MLRRLAMVALLSAVLAAPAHAQGTPLLPGVTYEKTVQFTPHGAVVLHVVTVPRPGGLYQLGPVLARSTILGGREKVTQIEKDVAAQSTSIGINGDLFNQADGHPSGIVLTGGLLLHPALSTRSSMGIDTDGTLHVDRVKFFGTWKGTGQRRPLDGLNQAPAQGRVVLFTPAWGSRVPAIPGAAEAVLQPFPAAAPNTDLAATVTATSVNGGDAIPPDGAVLQATGALAPALQAEAPVGTPITTRLILQPAWTGVTEGLGGGPVLVRRGAPVFRSLEDFTNDQVAARSPRAGIGQLADGRIILVAVDGDQPGYSVGLTSFELAQAMARLGAVSAAAVESGPSVTVAFDGQLLNRPSTGERAVKEALLLQYFGVYAPPPAPLLTGEAGKTDQQLVYKIVRPSKVTAELIGPDAVPRVLEAAVQHDPGSYSFTYSAFDQEGLWHWNVNATDDLGRTSTIDRPFRYDTTLRALAVPKVATKALTVRFTLSRPATVKLRIETVNGVLVRELSPLNLQTGPQSVTWDGTLPQRTRTASGAYVAHVFVTSTVGTSDQAVQFTFRRG